MTEFLETIGVGMFLSIRRNVGMDVVLPRAKCLLTHQLPMMGHRKEGRKEGAKQDRPEVVRLS